MNDTKKSRAGATRDTPAEGWTDAERAAMQEHAQELKRAKQRGGASKGDGEADVLAKIAGMPPSDRAIAERIHEIVKANAPGLVPRTWYGMPAYAKDGKVVCFFQAADKFKARYATFGFNDIAKLDDGAMWPTAWAIATLTTADEQRIGELVRRAAS